MSSQKPDPLGKFLYWAFICTVGFIILSSLFDSARNGPPEWKEPDRYEHISPELEKALESAAQKQGQSIYGD